MNGPLVRRDIADLILEALDIAGSRRLARPETHVLTVEVVTAERPDITARAAKILIDLFYRRRFDKG